MSAHETFQRAADNAMRLSFQCLEDAKDATFLQAIHLIAESERHEERAEFYQQRVRWYAPKEESADE